MEAEHGANAKGVKVYDVCNRLLPSKGVSMWSMYIPVRLVKLFTRKDWLVGVDTHAQLSQIKSNTEDAYGSYWLKLT